MALVRKQSPVNEDAPIDKIQVALYNGLVTNGTWTNYESYHRAYKNETPEGIRPEIFRGTEKGNDYWDTFMNDDFSATSFFLVPDNIPIEDGMHSAVISIIFQVNLEKLYPEATHRFDAEMRNEVANILKNLDGTFSYVDTLTSISEVYAGLDTSKVVWDDMQKFHVVRFDVEANFIPSCGNVFATTGASCNINVTVSTENESISGAGDGTAIANVTGVINGTLSYLWDTSPPRTTQEITGLGAGDYEVIVTDSIPANPACTAINSGTVEAGTFSFVSKLKYDGSVTSVDHDNIDVNSNDDFVHVTWWDTEDLTGRVFVSGSSTNGLTIQNSTTLRIFMQNTVYDFTVPEMSLNTRYMASFVRVLGILRCYLGKTESTTGGVAATESTIFNKIGSFSNPAAGWKGHIYQVGLRVGSGATSTDIENLFNDNDGANFSDVITSPTAEWRYTESGTDSTAIDTTGNFNGTLNNFIFTPSPWIAV